MKRKSYEEAGLPQPTEPSPKKQVLVQEKQISMATSQSVTVEPQAKKQNNGKQTKNV